MELINAITKKYNVSLSTRSVEEFAAIMERKEYDKGAIILNHGEVSRSMFIVQKGIIRQFYYKDGRDITEHFSCEISIASCIESLFLKQPTNVLVEAIEPSVVYLLDYAKFEQLCDQYADINQLFRRILEYKLVVSQRKADSWRFETSHERYERFCIEYPSVAARASVAHIASYLLMTPETLSRVRSGIL